ncbi:disease resistance protein L6-like isoform X2 [Rhodamnia argentea]|uniref:Disease resistance protein L6-like isoform X2 n=1 Tax=Rhodamnia argentea TaxID=178133 RepID=A0ABM3HAB2_9MYRT|nr:disease resistance protein L6-like isoform X2 [Rhodamnia argentea]
MANLEARTSSVGAPGGEYQVFLSFRGADTRYGFTDCLYHALVGAGIRVFRDEDELRVGEVIGGELLRAIDDSILYIPVFSQNYATSKWCLREIARILPIFFDVEPDDVKLKTSLYKDSLLEHEKRFPEEVKARRKALVKVDEIKGWNLKKDEGQGQLIKWVVEEVLDKLKIKHKPVTERLVGLTGLVEDVMKLLDIDSGDVRLIKIHGMGGIGKTTLAKVIFNQLTPQFGKRCSFLEDIREESKKDGLVKLQEKLLSDIVHSRAIEKIPDTDYGMRRTGEILCNKRVLIVLDDIDRGEQIEKLLGKYSLHPGTRIIVTTRDRSVLPIKGFKYTVLPYPMEELNFNHALQLFERHAFGGLSPSDDQHVLARAIVSTTGGLPLALEVIGSLLYQKPKAIWSETLDKLREMPEKEVQRKLKISYDMLDDYQQQIFLDIACFFINEDKTNAIYMWTDCRFFPEGGIDVLISLSPIKILDNNKFWMHDQLRDLGREMVHKESLTDPGERSRLWISKDILEILRTKESKKKVQAFDLDGKASPNLITNEQLERFGSLRFLKLCNTTFVGDFSECLSKIVWFSWHSPPQSFWAVNMHSRNIVVLELSDNHFTDDSEVWSFFKMATKLKVLALKWCFGITRTPDFSKCLMLERLTLERCDNLTEIDCSIGRLKYLIDLNINGCLRLEELPKEIGGLEKLKRFSLTDCYREEAKMEGDAKEPDTEVLLQFHPSASSRDHEISEEPPLDNVREGTPPGEENHTTEQDSSSLSPDELVPPRTFSDRFKTCLVSILECVCNRDFS